MGDQEPSVTAKPWEPSWREKFQSKAVSEEAYKTLDTVRISFGNIAEHLQGLLPDGRYKALVLTQLESAAMFATKCFSHNN